MPELPEVETLKIQIDEVLVGLEVKQVTVIDERASGAPGEIKKLKNKKLTGVRRRGKTLILDFNGGLTALIHLRISGRVFLTGSHEASPRGAMVEFSFENLKKLVFTYLHLGFMNVYETGEANAALSRQYGPEAPSVDKKWLLENLRGNKKNIKALLLDQGFIAGIGNIYVDEILFQAKISPFRTAGSLTKAETGRIYTAIKSILPEAIKLRGTTIQSWSDLYDRNGEYQNKLNVVQRSGEPCPICKRPIKKTKTAGRTTYYCTHCQI